MIPLQDIRIIETTVDHDDTLNVNSQAQLTAPTTTKVYKYRWIIIWLSMTTSVLNGFHWLQYSIISNVVQQYYGVESKYVDWLSITFMFAYLPFIYPAMWLMDKMGLKVICVLDSALICLAAWIKVVSVRPDLFYVTFIGQAIAGIGQVYYMNAPPRVAAVWFGEDQVSLACSIGVFGNQLGLALGFLLPPILVKPSDEINEIGRGLSTMSYMLAGMCTIQLVLVLLFFRNKPKLPPSPGQATRVTETPAFVDSLKRLSKNRGFVLLTVSYGLVIGVLDALSTVLNQMVLAYFPGHEEDAGRIGLTLMVAGMVGAVVSGVILDKTHTFKATALALNAISTFGMLAFTFSLQTNLGVVYGIAALLGFSVTAFLSVGFEFAAEITYPETEGTTAGIINASVIVFSILLTFATSALLNAVGDVWSNVTFVVILLIATILTAIIKQDLRRQAAHALGEKKGNLSVANTLRS